MSKFYRIEDIDKQLDEEQPQGAPKKSLSFFSRLRSALFRKNPNNADFRYPPAQHGLAFCCENGIGVKKIVIMNKRQSGHS